MCGSSHYRTYGRPYGTRRRPEQDERIAETTTENLRVSDAERQQTIDQLTRHTADGRLSLDEFEGRVDEVMRARTASELAAALRDLPVVERRIQRRPSARRVPVPWVIAALVVAVALIPEGLIWLLIPVAIWSFGGCHGRSRRDGIRPDHEMTLV
jgi:uncharacterized protein DUF1707